MQAKTLLLEKISDYTLLVTLNRPEVRNAINSDMMADLNELWQTLSHDPNGIRAVILTGQGNKAFCAGADLKERNEQTLEAFTESHRILESAMQAMLDCPIPIISAVNGAAYGGGLELVLAADFAIGTTQASFCQSEAKLGLIPGAMGTQLLPRAVGIRRAKDMLFTAKVVNAKDACSWGILNEVVGVRSLMKRCKELATSIEALAPNAISAAKTAMQHLINHDNGYAVELEQYYQVLESDNRIEGIRAFNEKRAPVFE